jgi:hypothetical protein
MKRWTGLLPYRLHALHTHIGTICAEVKVNSKPYGPKSFISKRRSTINKHAVYVPPIRALRGTNSLKETLAYTFKGTVAGAF